MKVTKKQLLQVTYSTAKTEKMKIFGILLSSRKRNVQQNHIISMIQQTPIMKLSDGVCTDGKHLSISYAQYEGQWHICLYIIKGTCVPTSVTACTYSTFLEAILNTST